MANIKRILAAGMLPFDCYQNPEFAHWLAFFAGPTSGVRIRWRETGVYRPSAHGGKTAMYAFHLAGEEAIRWPALEQLKDLLERLGEVQEWDAVDIEGGG